MKSYVQFTTLFNSKMYAAICAQIEHGTFIANVDRENAQAEISGTVGNTPWTLWLYLNPDNSCKNLSIDSDTATPYITTRAGRFLELVPQDDYNGPSVINTAMLGHGGGTFAPYLLDIIENS